MLGWNEFAKLSANPGPNGSAQAASTRVQRCFNINGMTYGAELVAAVALGMRRYGKSLRMDFSLTMPASNHLEI